MKKWRCKICDYVHIGDVPPEVCPLCGASAEFFEPVEEAAQTINPEAYDRLQQALLAVPCGLVIVASRSADGTRVNGMVNNTVFQITNTPLQVALGMDKQHLTTEMIRESGVFSVLLLTRQQMGLVKTFGFCSGRQQDKFAGIEWEKGATGAPVIKDCAGYFECRVVAGRTMDAGTHLVFLGEVVEGMVQPESKILTYQEYRQHKQELG